uniref:Nudix hydrolase domain-containing protein n=1 Tax=Panagrellus redivivus TaxID=6233 RepID=A0A7E4VQQ1_PANRE
MADGKEELPESAIDCPYELKNEQTVFSGKWLIAKSIDFKLRGGVNSGVWMSAHRPVLGNPKINANGVDIIAYLLKDGLKFLILIKQYRIPIRRWILEFPAGLIDEDDESVEAAGKRELKEETGYTVTRTLKVVKRGKYLNPGFTSDSVAFLVCEVDGTALENLNPKQNLDGDENIEVVLVESTRVLDFLNEAADRGEVEVSVQVYTWALSKLFA